MGAPGLDFETWDSANLNARNYAVGDLADPRRHTRKLFSSKVFAQYSARRPGSVREVISMNPSEQIDKQIAELADWRGDVLAKLRKIIHDADPEVIEEWKWMGTPTWSHDGIFVIANAHKDKVKMTFSHGASLPDPEKVFNAMLEGNKWRAIDFYEGDKINERALKNLIHSAIGLNTASLKKKTSKTRPKAKKKS